MVRLLPLLLIILRMLILPSFISPFISPSVTIQHTVQRTVSLNIFPKDAPSFPPQYSLHNLTKPTGIQFSTTLSFTGAFITGVNPSSKYLNSVGLNHTLLKIDSENVEFKPFDSIIESLNSDYTSLTLSSLPRPTKIPNATLTVRDFKNPSFLKLLSCAPGSSIRDVLLSNSISPYRSLTKLTNCKGKQLCGTCIVDVKDQSSLSRKSIDESSTLKGRESMRLSCVTGVWGDTEVWINGDVRADQWTR
ncbi:hypothetical protein TrVE_jg289 [Triparma verrucosa]|uniref:2Fe-2S ferredoxin-type domain-containing protein n=1 Tax=Triparma verrucosa TaxID=1606542 RepID=A0A9W7CC08_9STRA|nr:hypothetical protein TrVE_jg289 [Triparma verrucosa]